MSTKLAVSDVNVNIDLHRPLVMSSISPNTRKNTQPVHHSLSIPPRNPTHLRSGDSSVHGGFLEGIPHVRARLDPRQFKSSAFAQQLLDIFRLLRVPSWSQTAAPFPFPCIRKVSGSLTNAVFFVSSPSTSSRTLLLRVYGPSSGVLIPRLRELQILHVLSSRSKLCPRIYGTFTNGRIEEYFDSVTLTATDIREPRISAYIGARMAELHSVDLEIIEGQSHGSSPEIGVRKNVQSWLPHARDVLALPMISQAIRKEFDLDKFQIKWESYMRWLNTTHVDTHPVLCHNDAQYGNILRLNSVEKGKPEHHQIIVVDFEYASPNPAAFDIANHFNEWTANYHGPSPHLLDALRYPTHDERRTFLTAYLKNRITPVDAPVNSPTPAFSELSPALRERELVALRNAVRAWSPSSHAMWAIWGLVQAREDVLAHVTKPDFDYIGHARCRMDAFYRELGALGV